MHPVVVALSVLFVGLAFAGPNPRSVCLGTSGEVATHCLDAYVEISSATPAFAEDVVLASCDDDTVYDLGGLGADNLVVVLRNACEDFGKEILRLTTPPTPAQPDQESCRDVLTSSLGALRERTIELLGPKCSVREAQGRRCRRSGQEARARKLARSTAKRITRACDGVYDGLGLVPVDELVATVLDRVRHFAQLVYPPNDLGPSGDPGEYPVGVRTLELVDASRMNADGTGPRPVTVEVWYPSTPEAVAGVERYVVNLFGFDVARTPTYHDVAVAAGPFPVVLFSHGNGGIRFQSIFLAAHLASHGYVVASPDHHGNTFLDLAGGIVDGAGVTNRPLDMQFILDDLVARNAVSGDFLQGAIDASRIGMSGHSFGGLTTLLLAAGPNLDTRIGAYMPLAPATLFDAAFLGSITAPILIQGGDLDATTPYDTQQLAPFQNLPSGATVVGLAKIVGAGHFTFSDICEVPRDLVGFIGGFDEACEPRHLPWRHAHDIINYLALNFFDASLSGDRAALKRLKPRTVASFGDVEYQSK